MTNIPLTAGVFSRRLLALPGNSVILIDGRIFAEKQLTVGDDAEYATFDSILTDSTAELAERLEVAGWDFVTVYTPDRGFAFPVPTIQDGESA